MTFVNLPSFAKKAQQSSLCGARLCAKHQPQRVETPDGFVLFGRAVPGQDDPAALRVRTRIAQTGSTRLAQVERVFYPAPVSPPHAKPRAGFLSEWWSKLTQSGSKTIGGSFPFEVCFRHRRTAKRYVITVRPEGTVAVTIPRHGTQQEAERFVQSRVEWIERTLSRMRQRPVSLGTWLAGTEVLFRGDRVPLRVAGSSGRWFVELAGESIPVASPDANLRAPVERYLRSLATAELPSRLMELARLHGCLVRKVVIRNQRTRWGSCSRRGTISLNWRLVQLPETVRDYILLHELMHLREMNHSKRFWREVSAVCPEYAEAEAWLKRQGSILGSEKPPKSGRESEP